MTIYSFWIFDRHCDCIYKKEWHKTPPRIGRRSAGSVNDFSRSKTVTARNTEHDAKLIFGIVFSLRNTVRKLTDEDSFLSYRTSRYRLHFYETPSNIRLVMISDPKIDTLRPVLHQIYVSLYVEYVVKNPVEHANGEGVNNELFVLGLDAFVTSLPEFE